MVPPDSPTTSTAGGDTGGDSSPISGTAPSFPSVYGPPMTGAPQAGGLASSTTGSGVGVGVGGAVTAAGNVPSATSSGRLTGVGAAPGTSGTSGSTMPTHQRSGRTPDNDDVTKMFSSLGL